MLTFCGARRTVLVALVVVGAVLVLLHRHSSLDSVMQLKWAPDRNDFGEQNEPSSEDVLSQMWSDLGDTLTWAKTSVPATRMLAHAPGWSIFDRLYVLEGVVYIVTDNVETIPPLQEITSKGLNIAEGNVNLQQLEPTDKEIKIVSTARAKELFGESAIRIAGVTFLVNESAQYMTHFYHFAAELLFGLWRTYSSLDQGIGTNGRTNLPAPRRIIFPHINMRQWRDYAALNQYILRALFPSLVLEFKDAWEERASIRDRVYVYDRVVFSDRVAAMHGDKFRQTDRIAAEALQIRASSYWWSAIRMPILEYSKVRKSDITHQKPVVTYVSRQLWGRRMLRTEDHNRLVSKLEKLRQRTGIEVHVVELDRMPRNEQVRLAARTTILMGVHGNGLTGLLWMNPTVKSTVIEFFYPGGFAQDYQWTAQALGIMHYGVWGKHIFTSPNLPARAFPEGFQGNKIPLDADAVIRLVEQRLGMEEEDFDD